MKKIISFSLWGDNPKYCVGAIKNAELRDKIYPDWICRFYVHEDVPKKYIDKLNSMNLVEVKTTKGKSDWKLAVERFKAIDDDDVECVIFRDTDSRLNSREAGAVEDWLSKETTLHLMRDHPRHGSFPILAGMWGLKKKKFPYDMSSTIKDYEEKKIEEQYHYDQIFLASYIWPSLNSDCTIHDEFFTDNPFPSNRTKNHFVGQSFDEYGKTPEEHLKEIEFQTK